MEKSGELCTLQPIQSVDSDCLETIVDETVRISVAENEEDAAFLIDDILGSLEKWFQSGSNGFHRKALVGEKVVAFIVVKDHWNLSHLFVLPSYQGTGIGHQLLTAAIDACRSQSPRQKIQLYSSNTAAEFYRSHGFAGTDPGIDRPGGCIPMEYQFPAT